MTSMFSRFRPEIVLPLLVASTLGLLLHAAGLLPPMALLPLAAAQLVLIAALALYFSVYLRVSRAITSTSMGIVQGDFEQRIVVPGLAGDLRRVVDGINAMIDLGDAFVRESALTMTAAAEGRFYRKIRPEGMKGAYLQASLRINEAVDRLAERPALMARLEASVGGMVEAAAAGDFSRRVEASFEDEALNRIAGGLNELATTVDRALSDASNVLSAMARADLRPRMTGEYRGACGRLQAGVNEVADALEAIVAGIIEASGKLKATQDEILAGATDLADRTNIGATAVEQTSAAMEEISVTTTENARKAASGRERADQVATSIEDVRASMQEADAAVRRIQTASEEIEGIVSLIDSIAFQTRLLALNASVEAARAGEAGRGFAVVASEVRNLAERVVASSGEIKELVEQSGGQVKQGSVLVAKAGTRLAEILELIRQNAEDMREIAAACGEQANAVTEISSAVAQLESATQQNAALVDKTTSQLKASESELVRIDTVARRFSLSRPAGARPARSASAANPIAPPVAAAQAKRPAAAPPPVAGNTALDPDDWSEF